MSPRLEPTDHRQHARPKDRSFQFRHVGCDLLAISGEVDSQPMFGHMDWRVEQFDMLNDFKLVRWCELTILDFLVIDFVFKGLIDSLRRQGVTKLPLMPRLAAPFAFL